MDALVCTYRSGAMSHTGLDRDAHPAAAKKSAVLVAPPKFREETSKKAVGRSPSARQRMAFVRARRKWFFAASQHLKIKPVFLWRN